jgi:hypothetical protein
MTTALEMSSSTEIILGGGGVAGHASSGIPGPPTLQSVQTGLEGNNNSALVATASIISLSMQQQQQQQHHHHETGSHHHHHHHHHHSHQQQDGLSEAGFGGSHAASEGFDDFGDLELGPSSEGDEQVSSVKN